MQNLWGNLIPQIYSTYGANVSKKATEAFDVEFEAFCAEQKKIKAEIEAKQAEAKLQIITEDIGNIPSEEATTKESKKRKSKKVTAETASDETLAF